MLELKDITIGYDKPLLAGANNTLHEGELVALIGRNGTGKSTLLQSISGVLTPLEGEVLIGGKPLVGLSEAERAKLISIVNTTRFQVPYLTAYELVALGRSPYTNHFGKLSPRDHKAVTKALEDTGMIGFAERPLTKMSDGERQRVMIARALAQDTPLILLDEPTAFLDLPNRYDLVLLLQKLAHEEGKLIIFSTHELDIALLVCDRIMLIHSQQLVTLTPDEMTQSGYLQRQFSNSQVRFDPHLRQVVISQ